MKKILISLVFISGYLIMSLEILGGRLLAPFFGNSIYIWGSLIGVILMALAGGYYLGGWLADFYQDKKNQRDARFFLDKLFFLAVIFLLLDLFFYPSVLKWLSSWDMIWGALLAALILFGVPMAALAAVSPLVIKILSQQEKTGYSAGLVYTWGTIGSILGTFLTTFYLIPYFGSRLTLYGCFFIALLALVGLFLLVDRRQGIIGIFIFLISLAVLRPPVLPQNVILETESAYNQIRLIQDDELIYMTLNSLGATLLQSVYVKNRTLLNVSLLDLFNIGAEITAAKNILILGMAGGASVRQFEQYFPEAKIEAVEIDSKIVAIAKEKFGISENEKLKIYIDDARPFLTKTEKKYDLVEVDLFQGSPYIPFYVLTREFFENLINVLSDDGAMVMNIYAPAKKEIIDPALATIATAFPSVYKIPINDNFLVLATKRKTTLKEIKKKIENASVMGEAGLTYINEYALMNMSDSFLDKKAPIFTDDWAPVEAITYKMLKGMRL